MKLGYHKLQKLEDLTIAGAGAVGPLSPLNLENKVMEQSTGLAGTS